MGADTFCSKTDTRASDAECKINLNKRTFRLASLNVCGLKKRGQYPDFSEMLNEYDLLFFLNLKLVRRT